MTQLHNCSILIIDDVPTNIQVLAETLRNDYNLKIATSGIDGLAIARQSKPDLILLDVMMPDMDGYEVSRQLKSDPLTQNIPFIFVSARDSPTDEELGLNLGAADYIYKPFHLPVVRARVRNQLLLKQKTDLLERLAHVDGLTGIANRRRFDEALDNELRRCHRAGQHISLLMIDIDFFKQYNDHFGHGRGDICLANVAHALTRHLPRAADLAARYGGEEFAVILPDTDNDGARQIAERLRKAVTDLNFPQAPDVAQSHVSISVGVGTHGPTTETDATAILNQADANLYTAKRTGRDRVCA